MPFYSTRNRNKAVSLYEAVLKALPADGGLYMPCQIPTLSAEFFKNLKGKTLQEIGITVASTLLAEDLNQEVIESVVKAALKFDAPLVKVSDNIYALELFHGPTLAFKDFGAAFMAALMEHFVRESGKELTILVATSGDTGSAVAHGFLGRSGISVVILYPSERVSPLQEKQLTTCGANITALEIEGSFDDCQRMVKSAFLDAELNARLNLTSANSINIARLIPQSFYYFYAVSQLEESRPPVISVPSGNFGNLTAGLIAKRMGLNIERFIAATNINDTFPEYLNTGNYRPRPSKETISNAMDVGAPSNFERILDLYNNSHGDIKEDIVSFSFDDQATRQAIRELYSACDYLADPHGAVGYLGLKKFQETGGSHSPAIFLETAHPAKFKETVAEATGSSIAVPERLRRCLDKQKITEKLPASDKALKDFLLSAKQG
ncbi:MAG: threonine synthase [Candidatus Dadabacteria bacterium]|nr:MAG: threonine synthase [Candidatus Dadabacteria bacterium]